MSLLVVTTSGVPLVIHDLSLEEFATLVDEALSGGVNLVDLEEDSGPLTLNLRSVAYFRASQG